MKNFLILILNSITIFSCLSQNNDSFTFPINPNNQNFLSGSMGELRGDHFHMGIDIKTRGKNGLPVYASKDGYVERIRVSSVGYGKAIYLNHGDGTKSIYAHLSKFNNELEEYILNEQYRIKSFEISKYPNKNKFNFKNGDLIAYSGNTGSSSGPHLHFEIRDYEDKVLDPLSYNFNEIVDTIPPTLEKIVFKTLDINSRINESFGYFEYKLSKENNIYSLDGKVSLRGKIGIAIYGYDKYNIAPNKNGIKTIEMYLNNKIIIKNKIDTLSYNETNNVVKYIDYDLYLLKNKQYIKLYQDDGNKLIIHKNNNNGIINIEDESSDEILIKLIDSYENKSTLKINNDSAKNVIKGFNKIDLNFKHSLISENTIEIKLNSNDRDFIEVIYDNGMIINKKLDYKLDDSKHFLIDLREKLPIKIITKEEEIDTKFISTILTNINSKFSHYDFELEVNNNDLFDTLYLRFNKKYDTINRTEIFSFLNRSDISKKPVNLKLRTENNYNNEKSHVYIVSDLDDYSFVGGKWENNYINFSTREFNDFTILTDTIPPIIKPVKINKSNLIFNVKDELSGIKEYVGKINKEWILFNYDYKRDLLFSQKLNKEDQLIGNFELKITDNAGNISIFKYQL